jgi:membrane fusion protein, multidrug efflux system
VRAPIDGRTRQRNVDIGNLVQSARGASLVLITQLKPIFVSFTVAQSSLDAVRQNQAKAALKTLAYAADDKTLLSQGDLTLIDNQVDVATGTIRPKATFQNNGARSGSLS